MIHSEPSNIQIEASTKIQLNNNNNNNNCMTITYHEKYTQMLLCYGHESAETASNVDNTNNMKA